MFRQIKPALVGLRRNPWTQVAAELFMTLRSKKLLMLETYLN